MTTPTLSRASRWFLERAGIVPTRRGPAPRWEPRLNAANGYPLAPPLPAPETLRASQGCPPPDRGPTTIWPNGLDGETAPVPGATA